ncbi:MAG: glutaredoxin [Deltaproteobacteria bacterium]|nr:glutaredoxin [Deltaproteobacteria bacterium]
MDQSVTAPSSSRRYWTTADIKQAIESSRVVVFCKGDREHPRCGYSEKAFELVESSGNPFQLIDVCEDSSIAAALGEYAGGNQKLPLIFLDGELVGTLETFAEQNTRGELLAKLQNGFLV